MNLISVRRSAAALLTALCLAVPAAARVEVNGVKLDRQEGWLENGRSYVTLYALSREGNYRLNWDGTCARLEGEDFVLTARPGAEYIEVNGRALYVPEGVPVMNDRTALPLRVLEDALGAAVSWDEDTLAARLDTTQARAATADYPEEDLYWLSRIISAESRGETLKGQIAVGNVVLNRRMAEEFPDSIKGVVFDRSHGVQFEPVENGTVYDMPAQSSVVAAKLVLEGADTVGECLYFYAPALSKGTWIAGNRTYYTTIGCHRFYL